MCASHAGRVLPVVELTPRAPRGTQRRWSHSGGAREEERLFANARAARLVFALRADLATGQVVDALAGRGLEALLLRGPVRSRHVCTRAASAPTETATCSFGETFRPKSRCAARARLLLVYELTASPSTGGRSDGVEIDLHVSLWGVRRPWPPSSGARLSAIGKASRSGGRRGSGARRRKRTGIRGRPCTPRSTGRSSATRSPISSGRSATSTQVWEQAAALARETGSLRAFRQGPHDAARGHGRLEALGLTTELSVQAAFRRRRRRATGLPARGPQRAGTAVLLGRRIAPRREEVAILVDQRAAESGRVLRSLTCAARRAPVRMLRLLASGAGPGGSRRVERRAAGRR